MARSTPLRSALPRWARRALGLGCLSLTACGVFAASEPASAPADGRAAALSVEPADGQATQQEASVGAPQDPQQSRPAQGRFAVHEWGLVVVGARGGVSIATAPVSAATAAPTRPERHPPRPPDRDLAPAKPVFYVHLDDGVDTARFSLGVRSVSRGRVLEHYPPAVRQERNTGLTWPAVVARRGACRGVYPGLTDSLCQTPDGVCELAELSAYETNDAACLQVGDESVGLLFYRMAGARDTLPLDVRPHPDGRVVVRSVIAPPGGLVLRVHRDPAFGRTTVRQVQLDADGRASVPPASQAAGLISAQRGLALLSSALDAAGLTAQERDAFLRAWRSALFGGEGPAASTVTSASPSTAGAPPPEGHPLAPVRDALLYFWPPAEVDAALPLTITPSPREVRRVFVVRVDLTQPAGR